MPSPTWLIDCACARLDLPALKATVDSAQPARGLTSLVLEGRPWSGTQLLGVSGAAWTSSAMSLVEWHVRGDDLVAAYEIGPPAAARIDLSWHAAAAREGEPWLACIDLTVSVRTDRLDWRHDVFIDGSIAAVTGIVLQASRLHFPLQAGRLHLNSPPGCLFFLTERAAYAEFVHPADLRRDELTASGGEPACHRFQRHLFPPESLEKGVILRARARGLFLPKDTTPAIVDRLYAEFIAADPPLGI